MTQEKAKAAGVLGISPHNGQKPAPNGAAGFWPPRTCGAEHAVGILCGSSLLAAGTKTRRLSPAPRRGVRRRRNQDRPAWSAVTH